MFHDNTALSQRFGLYKCVCILTIGRLEWNARLRIYQTRVYSCINKKSRKGSGFCSAYHLWRTDSPTSCTTENAPPAFHPHRCESGWLQLPPHAPPRLARQQALAADQFPQEPPLLQPEQHFLSPPFQLRNPQQPQHHHSSPRFSPTTSSAARFLACAPARRCFSFEEESCLFWEARRRRRGRGSP